MKEIEWMAGYPIELSAMKQSTLAYRANLRERIISKTVHVKQEVERSERLARLIFLTEKNPDFIEIAALLQSLDLM